MRRQRRLCPGPCCAAERLRARGPAGRHLCRWCAVEVRPPRRTFCSDECVKTFQQIHWPAVMRQAVWERDRGVCALCGAETEAEWLAAEASRDWRALQALRQRRGGRHVWEADHTVPLVEGGVNRLDNMRTLCCACHAQQTAALAARRARARRDARAFPLLDAPGPRGEEVQDA